MKTTCLLLAGFFLGTPLGASVVGMNTPSSPVSEARIATLPKAEQAAWHTYLERSEKKQAEDKAVFAAELKAANLTAPLIPPLGRNAASVPGEDQPESWYRTDEARHLADIVVSFQTPSGGWSKNLNLRDHIRRPGELWAAENGSKFLSTMDFDRPENPSWHYIATIDNDATTTEIRFLGKIGDRLKDKDGERYRAAFQRGVEYLFEAQFPNGGWPQVWPLEGGYHDAITYNDDAMIQVLEVLQEIAAGRYGFVTPALRGEAAESVMKGIGCILATQIVVNGHKTAWAQQHDALTLQATSARNFEPPAETAAESAHILEFLMNLQHPSPAIVEAVNAGITWLNKTEIQGEVWQRQNGMRALVPAQGAAPLWARYYEISTNRPIFGDRDRTIHDNVQELSTERRNGYAWFSSQPESALERYAKWQRSPAAK